MATADVQSIKFDKSNDERINLTFQQSDGSAQDITGWDITLDVGDGELTETATITDAAAGEAAFVLDNTETALTGNYYYSMDYVTDSSVHETFLRGVMSWYDSPDGNGGSSTTEITVTAGEDLSVTVNTAAPTYTDEEVMDVVATFLRAGDKLSLTEDDEADTLTINTNALDEEEVEDV